MDLMTGIKLGASAVVFVVFLVLYCKRRHDVMDEPDIKKAKKKKRLPFFGMLIAAWFFAATAVNLVTGGSKGIGVEFAMFAPRVQIGSFSVAQTTVTGYIVLGAVTILALLFRVFAVPKFKDEPKGLQNAMEAAVEFVDKFVHDNAGDLSAELPAYMFSVAVFLVGCAMAELAGQRPPTSDIEVTFSLAQCTFFLINYYGIKKKRLSGRIKALASPSPLIMPMKMLSDCATPVSLACRLFGNMLGGMIVMDLLKNSLGGYAVGMTALAGLYFNLFHPLIQTYIFIVLSLTFIREATE